MFHSSTGKMSCGQMKPQLMLWVEKKRHSTPTPKPHPNCEIWWRGHHGLGLPCCLRAGTDCCHQRNNEFTSLSRGFAGKPKTACPPTEAQQRTGEATGQRPKTSKGINNRMASTVCLLEWPSQSPDLTPDIPRILLN